MALPPIPEETIEFPIEWCGRVMARADAANVPGDIQSVLLQFGIVATPQRHRSSAKGNYVSYTVSAVIQDRAMLHEVTNALAAVEGVRLVL